MDVTDTKTINAIYAVADALVSHMQNVSTEDDEHMCQMRGLIDALAIIKGKIE